MPDLHVDVLRVQPFTMAGQRSLRREEVTDPLAADLDVVYSSEPILTAPEQHDAANPGERAPHAWVQLAGRRVSSLDLFDGRLTVVAATLGPATSP